MTEPIRDLALVGAGPIGLELAVALQRHGFDYVHLEKGQVGQTMTWFPRQMHFFSSNDRIAIAGVPIQTLDQSKATREEYLAYLRQIVGAFDLQVQTYEPVTAIERDAAGLFTLTTAPAAGPRHYRARRVVLATGDMAGPRRLGIPGEDLGHVTHYFDEPHRYFRRRLLIVGGKNSAAETALRCYHSGAAVTLSYRGEAFSSSSVKYWLLPELEGRIERGEIACHYRTTPLAITPTHVSLRREDSGETFDVEADFVLLMTGYVGDLTLCRMAGVEIAGDPPAPRFDPATMETNVPGLHVIGTATAGSQRSYSIFIENCHVHVERMIAQLTGAPPPPPEDSAPRRLPES